MGEASKQRSSDEFVRNVVRPEMTRRAEDVYNHCCDDRRRELIRKGVLVPVSDMFGWSLNA